VLCYVEICLVALALDIREDKWDMPSILCVHLVRVTPFYPLLVCDGWSLLSVTAAASSDRVWILVVNHTGPRRGGGWLRGQRLLPQDIFFFVFTRVPRGSFHYYRPDHWWFHTAQLLRYATLTAEQPPLRHISRWVRLIISPSRISIKRRWLQNAGLRNELYKLQFSVCHIWGPLTWWWLKVDVFLDETPCSLVKACRLFGVKSFLTCQHSNLNSIVHSIIRIAYRYHFHCVRPYHYQCVSPYRYQCISPYHYQ